MLHTVKPGMEYRQWRSPVEYLRNLVEKCAVQWQFSETKYERERDGGVIESLCAREKEDDATLRPVSVRLEV